MPVVLAKGVVEVLVEEVNPLPFKIVKTGEEEVETSL